MVNSNSVEIKWRYLQIMSEMVNFSPNSAISFSQYDNTVVVGQVVEDPEVLQQIQDAWKYFIDSGQVWALVIGLFLGYLFRTFIS
ncbi:MAG: hypothetical protein ABEI32_07685 [Halothece sp.]